MYADLSILVRQLILLTEHRWLQWKKEEKLMLDRRQRK